MNSNPDADAELGLDVAVHGEAATALEAVVHEMAQNFQTGFLGGLDGIDVSLPLPLMILNFSCFLPY